MSAISENGVGADARNIRDCRNEKNVSRQFINLIRGTIICFHTLLLAAAAFYVEYTLHRVHRKYIHAICSHR